MIKLCFIENKLKSIEKRELLAEHGSTLTVLENIAKNCEDFQGFTMQFSSTSVESYFTVQCSCQKPEHALVICAVKNISYFKECLEELNQKFKKIPENTRKYQ